MPDWVTVKRFAELTGYGEDAIRQKLSTRLWREGIVWRKARDNRVLISQSGFDAWVEGRESELSEKRLSSWISGGRASGAANEYGSSLPPRTSNLPQT